MDALLPLDIPGWDTGLALPDAEQVRRRAGNAAAQARRRARLAEAGEPAPRGARRDRGPGTGSHHGPRNEARFVGVDGEGAGTDAMGRQQFLLLRAGVMELFRNNRPLTTVECLDFLASLPANRVHVGFAFGYDATMILRDLPRDRLDRMFMTQADKDKLGIQYKYVYFDNYAIDYMPKQYLRVARVKGGKIVKHSARTVYEVFGFFQCSFVKALRQFSIGLDVIDEIERQKSRRSDFQSMTNDVRDYCRMECELLAQLMEEFRSVCHAGGITPRTWNGAGKLASALHKAHDTPRREAIAVPLGTMRLAAAAYYGGRFEVTRTGQVEGPIHEYDIRSAYPAAMQTLPCLLHGQWREFTGHPRHGGLFVAECRFVHPAGVPLCGLPVRNRHGRLFWPRQGQGVYWSVEIDAARKLGMSCEYGKGSEYVSDCHCRPFAWVRDLYDYRRSIGAAVRGYPIKLGINSLYGQLARRVGGGGPWTNHLWAGLITAATRAWLVEAAAQAPADIVMLATDGIYSRAPLSLDVGTELGQWEHAEHPSMFVVQPGLYWGPPRPKTRGISAKVFTPHTGRFEAAWRRWMEAEMAAVGPSRLARMTLEDVGFCTVSITNFIGLKLAHARGKPETAGVWSQDTRRISFDWSVKRQLGTALADGQAMRHFPHDGAPDLISLSYAPRDDFDSMAAQLADLTEAMPDFLDFGPPGFAED